MRYVLIPILILSAAGCATVDGGGPAFNMLTTQEEVEIGTQMAAQVEKQAKTLDDSVIQQYVRNIGQRLAQYAPRQDVSYIFTVIDDPDAMNAFALPGGQVFITEALYAALETEGQLAGVLGHEIGHVLSRHGNKQMARQGMFQGLAGAIGVLGGTQESAQAAQMISATLSMKYGREAELESDDWGVRLCYQAGYDPRAMIGVMKVLEEAGGGQAPPEFFSTHPKPANRVEFIERAIEKYFPSGVPDNLRK